MEVGIRFRVLRLWHVFFGIVFRVSYLHFPRMCFFLLFEAAFPLGSFSFLSSKVRNQTILLHFHFLLNFRLLLFQISAPKFSRHPHTLCLRIFSKHYFKLILCFNVPVSYPLIDYFSCKTHLIQGFIFLMSFSCQNHEFFGFLFFSPPTAFFPNTLSVTLCVAPKQAVYKSDFFMYLFLI